jgi:hypothetical protein
MLAHIDERGNALLDSVSFGGQKADAALGRFPNGKGAFRELPPTPGKKNKGPK